MNNSHTAMIEQSADLLEKLRTRWKAARANGDDQAMADIEAQAAHIKAMVHTRPRVVCDVDHTETGSHKCGRCAGTGQFITGIENGKPIGPGGICFRCDGKGKHTQADRRRNDYHDRHQIVHM